ncbi:survival of motor neuron-related-splicing factor 30-like [Acanthaster planci]|uniref:Survival of motor neuron-related-splicing factor 30-like n=1 Tax=Acanthaster planci TaxID=133434 RepID=A0A8B7YET1_ACAPL|nr:survival of motor neuron-related-splicing factor 30-like [Acanthaster planci]
MAEVSEDWQTNLSTYRAQLQQVEAALTNDPENEELIKLKADLQDVIELTLDLIQAGPGAKSEGDEVEKEMTETSSWGVGDNCQALYSEDGLYYEGKIDEVHMDGTVTVTFEGYGNTEIVQISKLKPSEQARGSKRSGDEADLNPKPLSKKELLAKRREYKKRKTQKKLEKLKQMEQKHEEQKNSWLNFSSKAIKSKKGMTKKSIFASPESSTGKVGIGTCGVGGAPMTKFDRPKHNVVRK